MLIGNDLVDRRAREAQGKGRDERFIRRVFTSAEAAWIRDAPDPDLALWMLWAGKEAAFKIARKLRPDVPFAHRLFEVMPLATATAALADPASTRGTVHVADVSEMVGERVAVEWECRSAFVHAIARFPATAQARVCASIVARDALAANTNADQGDEAVHDFSPRELASARSEESVAVRRLAKRLAREAGLGEVEIVRIETERRFGPPLMFLPGSSDRVDGWDLSLSHDGDLVAAVLGCDG